jgi:hypothetical protein
MTERQKMIDRKRVAARRARIDREIERFIRMAKIVRRSSDEYRDVVEYACPTVEGLRLRIETRKQQATVSGGSYS